MNSIVLVEICKGLGILNHIPYQINSMGCNEVGIDLAALRNHSEYGVSKVTYITTVH